METRETPAMNSAEESREPDVSIIIVNWNTRKLLEDCLASIVSGSGDIRTETYVIDNGSTDGSQEMVSERFPDVILIQNRENRGFAAANNQALKLCSGKYALLLNSDAALMDGTLESVFGFAEENPGIGMVGCRVLNSDGSLQVSCMRYPDLLGLLGSALFLPKLFPKSSWMGHEDLVWWAHDEDRSVEVIKGCFILARASAVREVGLLDERFWLYGEETDWCYRMRHAGWDVRFTDRARIVHHGGASTDRMPGGIHHQLWGAKLQFIEKHRSPFYLKLCCSAVGLWFLVRILVSLVFPLCGRQSLKAFRQRMAANGAGFWKLLRYGPSSLVKSPLHISSIS
jgi:GT2 family glycosyltransferase